MSPARLAVAAAAVAALAAAAVALAKGPPPAPAPDPPVDVIVAHGSAAQRVRAPAPHSDASIQRAVEVARHAAIPAAVTAARAEARHLGDATGLRALRVVGVARDVAPMGSYDEESGRFGPGRWCGRIWRGRDARPRWRQGCQPPRHVAVRVTVTWATTAPR